MNLLYETEQNEDSLDLNQGYQTHLVYLLRKTCFIGMIVTNKKIKPNNSAT